MNIKDCYVDKLYRDYWLVMHDKVTYNPYDCVFKNKRTGEVLVVFYEYIYDTFEDPPKLWEILWE